MCASFSTLIFDFFKLNALCSSKGYLVNRFFQRADPLQAIFYRQGFLLHLSQKLFPKDSHPMMSRPFAHESGTVWLRSQSGTDRLIVHTGCKSSAPVWFRYPYQRGTDKRTETCGSDLFGSCVNPRIGSKKRCR